MFKRTYKAGRDGFTGSTGHDYRAGSKVADNDLEDLNVEALEASGRLKLDEVEKEPCPACEQEGVAKAKIPEFDNLEDMREHYLKEHLAYEPPPWEG